MIVYKDSMEKCNSTASERGANPRGVGNMATEKCRNCGGEASYVGFDELMDEYMWHCARCGCTFDGNAP